MALEKISKVVNVGRFTSLTSDAAFGPLTLIYGANGQGKTTLASVLRSLKTGLKDYILERATLGETGEPQVELRFDGAELKFTGKAWNKTAAELEIFDTTFITDNVYTGNHVDTEHRKNMYDVVVGGAAVTLARRVDQIDGDSRAVAARVRDAEDQLRRVIQAPLSLDEFLALKPEKGIEKLIEQATVRLGALRKSQEILRRRELQAVALPVLSERVRDALRPSAEKIATTVEKLVREHIEGRLDEHGEEWLSQAVGYLGEEKDCPFCAQSTKGVDQVKAFQQYFSDAYQQQGVAVQQAINELEQTLGEAAFARCQRTLLENDAAVQLWADLSDLGYARLSPEKIEGKWRNLREVVAAALKRRLSNPAEKAPNDRKLKAALKDFEDVTRLITTHNDNVRLANEEIAKLKAQTGATKQADVEGELRRLRNVQIRQTHEVDVLCSGLVAARADKAAFEKEKTAAKAELDGLSKDVLTEYEAAINALLAQFGVAFALTGTRPSFQGGKASSTYQLAINSTVFELGSAGSKAPSPSFRTALSAGDKNTLALAFFLARLQRDPELSKKVIVLDDPVSSLDANRAAQVLQQIRALASTAAQVVVLSHDPVFLKQLADGGKARTLHLVTAGAGFALEPWAT